MKKQFGQIAGRTWMVCGGLGLAMLSATSASAQPVAGGTRNMTFEDEQPGFIAFGDGAKVGINRDAAFVKNGNAALRFDYTIARNGFQAMLMPVVGGLADMKSLKFWIRTDHTTPMAVALQEGEAGARYVAVFTSPKDKWQQVELAPENFQFMDDENSPKDANNKLDLDQVMFLAVGDFGQFLAMMAQGPLAGVVNVQMGAHALHIDDFTIGTQPLTMPAMEAGEVAIDPFAHPQLAWFSIGDARLERVEKAAGDKPMPGMQIDYRQVPNKFVAVMGRISKGKLRGMGSLKMQVSSERAVTLAVQLEEAGGGKYFATVDVKAGAEPQSVELGFDNFQASPDSKDQNKQLNPEQVQQILFVDTAVFLGQADNKTNVLWIGNLRATP